MEKNKYLKMWIFSVIFLLGLCFIGIGTDKGTSAATNNTPKVTLDCPTGYQPTIDNDKCIKRDQTLTRAECEQQEGSYTSSNGNDTCVFVSEPNYYTIAIDLNYNYTDSNYPNGYTVPRSCDTDDGTSTSCSITLHHPTRTGYDFKGWTEEKNCSYDAIKDMSNSKTISINSTFGTLYACWKETSSSSSTTKNCYYSTEEGKYVSLTPEEAERVTEEGYTLKHSGECDGTEGGSTNKTCFKCSTDSNNTKYDVNQPTSGCAGTWQSTQESACDKTYIAQFKDTASSYTKQKTCTIKANELDTKTTCEVELPSENPQQEGKTFIGWTETENLCSNPKTTGKINNVGKNGKTLHACWSTSVEVTFNPTSEGTISGKSRGETKKLTCSYKSGEEFCKLSENPSATKNNQEFLGWDESTECKMPTKDIKSKPFKENTTLTACYAEPAETDKEVTATFDANGGTLSGKKTDKCTIKSGKISCEIDDLPTATYDGYTFGGWGMSKKCKSGNQTKVTLTGTTTFYACWNEINDEEEPPVDEPSSEEPSSDNNNDNTNDNNNENDDNIGDNVENNPGTGQIAIFIVWIVAFCAIGYSIYYYKEIKEN